MTSLQEQVSGKAAGILTRRRFLTGAAGIAALALAACGGGTASPTTAPTVAPTARPSTAPSAAPSTAPSAAPSSAAAVSAAPSTAASAAPAASAAATASRVATAAASGTARSTVALPAPSGFPATVTHQYGTTEVKAAPQRVISVGYNDQDAILACGVVPVAMLRWFAAQPKAVGPWAEPYLKGASPEIIPPTELDYENLIKLKPDLITGIYREMKPEEYQRLSTIAPTVSQPTGFVPFGVPWRDEARMVAAALGQKAAMEQIIAGVEGQFTAAKNANPQFAGKTCAVALASSNGQYYGYGKQDSRARFVETLGLTISPKLDDGTRKEFSFALSTEQLQLLEADILVMIAGTAELAQKVRNEALIQQLNVAKRGSLVLVEDITLTQAFSMNSVLSLPFAIEQMVPMLQKAVK